LLEQSEDISSRNPTVKVAHDLQRQVLEITSFLRVMNNYYKRKFQLQNQIKPLYLKKSRKKLINSKKDRDWLHTMPINLNIIKEDYINKKDSFKFPDSIKLFETWMNLGIEALFPRIVLQFKFPGFLKKEKVRNVFQFIYSTSRGFGFPIYFGPEFYGYKFKFSRILEPLLKWSYNVSHLANQAIILGNKLLKFKRHHPGEFESVIISEYFNNTYKGIDTLLHGYFKNEPKDLGVFSSIESVLQNSMFYYSIGDHAMKIKKNVTGKTLTLPLITHNSIVKKYDIDFYSYVRKLLTVNKLLIQKINFYKELRNKLINQLKRIDKIKYRLEQSKHFAKEITKMSQKLSKKYPQINKYGHYKILIEKIRNLLFTTPLYMHAIFSRREDDNSLQFFKQNREESDEIEQELENSALLSFIYNYEKKYNFIFKEVEVVRELAQLRDSMANMWLNFKKRYINYALKKLSELSKMQMEEESCREKIKKTLEKLLPIIAIYEIFNRPLFESVYPESISLIKRWGSYIARFLTSKYNPLGVNLMQLFNRLAFYNWSHLIMKKKLDINLFFTYVLKLPIWKYIPVKIKAKILEFSA